MAAAAPGALIWQSYLAATPAAAVPQLTLHLVTQTDQENVELGWSI